MTHAHSQHDRLAQMLRWGRTHGWSRSLSGNEYRCGNTSVSFDTVGRDLIIDIFETPFGWLNVSTIRVATIDEAINVLAALDLVPSELCRLHMRGYAIGFRSCNRLVSGAVT